MSTGISFTYQSGSNNKIITGSSYNSNNGPPVVIIPPTVTSILNSAFKSLTSVITKISFALDANGNSSISDISSFNFLVNLTEVIIPSSVTSLGAISGAFQKCTK